MKLVILKFRILLCRLESLPLASPYWKNGAQIRYFWKKKLLYYSFYVKIVSNKLNYRNFLCKIIKWLHYYYKNERTSAFLRRNVKYSQMRECVRASSARIGSALRGEMPLRWGSDSRRRASTSSVKIRRTPEHTCRETTGGNDSYYRINCFFFFYSFIDRHLTAISPDVMWRCGRRWSMPG